jgi:hypothetical protein
MLKILSRDITVTQRLECSNRLIGWNRHVVWTSLSWGRWGVHKRWDHLGHVNMACCTVVYWKWSLERWEHGLDLISWGYAPVGEFCEKSNEPLLLKRRGIFWQIERVLFSQVGLSWMNVKVMTYLKQHLKKIFYSYVCCVVLSYSCM